MTANRRLKLYFEQWAHKELRHREDYRPGLPPGAGWYESPTRGPSAIAHGGIGFGSDVRLVT